MTAMTEPLFYGAKVVTTGKGKASVIINNDCSKQPAFRQSGELTCQ